MCYNINYIIMACNLEKFPLEVGPSEKKICSSENPLVCKSTWERPISNKLSPTLPHINSLSGIPNHMPGLVPTPSLAHCLNEITFIHNS